MILSLKNNTIFGLIGSLVLLAACNGDTTPDTEVDPPRSRIVSENDGQGWLENTNAVTVSIDVNNNVSGDNLSRASGTVANYLSLVARGSVLIPNDYFIDTTPTNDKFYINSNGKLPYALFITYEDQLKVEHAAVIRPDAFYLTPEGGIIVGHQVRKGDVLRQKNSNVVVKKAITGEYYGGIVFPKSETEFFGTANDLVFVSEKTFSESTANLEFIYLSPTTIRMEATDHINSREIKFLDGSIFIPHQNYNAETFAHFTNNPVIINSSNDADPFGIFTARFNPTAVEEYQILIDKFNSSPYGHNDPNGNGRIIFGIDFTCPAERNPASNDCPRDQANAYATYNSLGQPIVNLNYGLVRLKGVNTDGLALVLAHEVGHHLPLLYRSYMNMNAPRYPHGMFCEAPSDYFGAKDVARNVWGDSDHQTVTATGIENIMTYFFTTEGGPLTRCGHPTKTCRRYFYTQGMNAQPIPPSHSCRSAE